VARQVAGHAVGEAVSEFANGRFGGSAPKLGTKEACTCLSREAGLRAASPQGAGAVGTIKRTVGRVLAGAGGGRPEGV
jgi:hypothetical protein